jgi:hypothetical protein
MKKSEIIFLKLIQSIFLFFVWKNSTSIALLFIESKTKFSRSKNMAAILIGYQEVLVIIVVTAIVVFIAARRKR